MEEKDEVLWTEDKELVGQPANEEDSLDAVCGECGNIQNEKRALMWLERGAQPVCGYCGGVCVLMRRSNRESALRQIDRQRGLLHDDKG